MAKEGKTIRNILWIDWSIFIKLVLIMSWLLYSWINMNFHSFFYLEEYGHIWVKYKYPCMNSLVNRRNEFVKNLIKSIFWINRTHQCILIFVHPLELSTHLYLFTSSYPRPHLVSRVEFRVRSWNLGQESNSWSQVTVKILG